MIKYITSDGKQATYLRDHLKIFFWWRQQQSLAI
jgi:hypothetical protein